jgi:hypothetical protein
MIILFSGHYHVLDSIDWYSFSCPSLADARPAKRRRTEGPTHTRQMRMFAESAGKAFGQINSGCKCPRKKYSSDSLGPAAE